MRLQDGRSGAARTPAGSTPDNAKASRGLSERFFGMMLSLYPRELRTEYGVDMARAFHDQMAHARRRDGAFAAGRLWLKTLGDVARTRWTARRDRRAGAARSRGPAGAGSPHPAPPGNFMDTIINDLRFGLRNFIRNPLFAAVATVTLAIGVGAAVTMFSGLSNFVLDPLPFAEQQQLYSLYSVAVGQGDADIALSYRDYLDLRDTSVFAESAAYYGTGYNLGGVDAPVRLDALRADAGLFATLGLDAEIGRVFSAAEQQSGAAVMVISDALWQRQFGGDPGIVGTAVRLDGEHYTIVGVMPADFWFPTPQYDAWLPLDVRPTTYGRDARFLGAVGRLRADIAPSEARARLSAVAERLEEAEPDTNTGIRAARLVPLASEVIWDEMRMALWMCAIVGVLVLLIACVNIANLLVARGMARRRELAVRAALGAGRGRLVRQYLAENLVLAVAGGAVGLLIARFGIAGIGAALAANEPGRVPRLQEYLTAGLDARVMLFALAASIGAVLFFSLLPALHTTRGVLQEGLQENTRRGGAGRRGRKLQKSLVVLEVALTLALLIGAGLALRSHAVVMQTDPGMEPRGLLTMAVALSGERYRDDNAALSFFDRVTEEFGALPGAGGAAATSSLPHARQGNFRGVAIEGQPTDDESVPSVNYVTITPDYFDVLGATLARGRALSARDTADTQPVAVINETAARYYWAGVDPVGSRVRLLAGGEDAPWIEIVGVVADIKNNGLHRSTWPAMYVPLQQAPARRMTLLLRAAGDPLAMVPAARAALGDIDPDLPLFRLMSMQQVLDNRFWGETLTMNLLAWCALGALLLAVVGIYGVISYAVNQRTHEMGVRIALGARAGDVVRLVVRQGMALAAVGIVIGLLLGFGLSRGLRFMLFGVSGNDPMTWLSVVALLATVALLASWIPARRATRVDPIVALRDE
jgi:putative ABC transport system permease protein